MILIKYILGIGLAALTLFSCSNKESLQRYIVDRQDDDSFLKIDIAASLLQTDSANLSQEEKDILKTIKKINVIAYPIEEGNVSAYEVKMQVLKTILDQDRYKTLMKYGSNKEGATLKYVGLEDAIDEIIVFVRDDEKGFALFRLLGDNMRPEQMIKLMTAIEKGDVDISKLNSIGKIFNM
ncbi:MAG: DUF4252 domain-containing protein [Flavobacteriaceae bacterium]|jgi:hypothetical protein|nr:DUF4252 domain-containing protein [Flavobacteriaceae bacterium]MBT3919677.1 DUF4252 domain-containing protein [Flavobacteriaceae bacterium]MBT6704679.1 DUF4252 domain-containing protein [Flavobacteriaceae bacterium]